MGGRFHPELGPGSFQEVINKRLLDPADILIGIVGKRLGSPTEKSVAGTVEEIEKFAAAKKPVLLYFSDREFSLSEIDTQELERVREFRKAMQTRGLFLTFKDIEDFKARLRSHLDSLLQDFQALLIPAGRALAYGLFKNFVEPTYRILRRARLWRELLVGDVPDRQVPEIVKCLNGAGYAGEENEGSHGPKKFLAHWFAFLRGSILQPQVEPKSAYSKLRFRFNPGCSPYYDTSPYSIVLSNFV
jgi:hypothetical protein